MQDPFRLAAEFNEKIIGLPAPDRPRMLSRDRKQRRMNHFYEEVLEYSQARTTADEVDALVDLIYVAAGALHEMGVDGMAHFTEVHEANMRRVRGDNPQRPTPDGQPVYDAVKPEGWVGPNHMTVMARAMFERHRKFQPRYESVYLGKCPISPLGDNPLLLEVPMTTHEGPLIYGKIGPSHNGGPKLILVGHGRHGKDTVAEMLRDRYGFRFCSSSLFCAERVMMPAFSEMGITYDSAETCFEDRHGFSAVGDHRTFWFDRIKEYCNPDKARLARELFEQNDIYVGMRDRRELWATKLAFPGVKVVWVDASDRLPPEQGSSMNIEPWMADFFLDNSGDLSQLELGVKRLMEYLR